MKKSIENLNENYNNKIISVKTIKNKKYLALLNNNVTILNDFMKKGYKTFFLPIDKYNFEFNYNIPYEEEKIYPFVEIENRYGKDYLLQLNNQEYINLKDNCRGFELLELEKNNEFKNNLINDLKNYINDKYIWKNETENENLIILLNELIYVGETILNFINKYNFD